MSDNFGGSCNDAAGSIYRVSLARVHMSVTGKRRGAGSKARTQMTTTLPNLPSRSPIETALVNVSRLLQRLRDRNRTPRQERRSMNG
jgi:hypothetical protein